jgi:hypothetical protein
MKTTSGGEFDGTPDLTSNIDLGLRTDAPISLAMNVGGTYKRLAFEVGDEYGGMYEDSGSGTVTVTTAGTPVKITQPDTAFPVRRTTADPTTDNDLTIDTAGDYFVWYKIDFSGTANRAYTVLLRKNDQGTPVDLPGGTTNRTLPTSGSQTGSCSGGGIFTLAANDTLALFVDADVDSSDFTVENLSIVAIKLA